MSRIFAAFFSILMLAGCVATNGSGEASLRLVEITPGCRVLADQEGIIRRPGPKLWDYTYAVGTCPVGIREQELGLTKVENITVAGHVATIKATHPKYGPYRLTVRRSTFPYGKERYAFVAYWPNGNPFLR